ncbi:MAG: septum formation initiator family protein [Acidobacteriota bacterium]
MKPIKLKIAFPTSNETLPVSGREKARKKRKKLTTRILAVLSVLFVLTLLVKAVFGDRGFLSVLRIQSEFASLCEEVGQLEEQNARLVKEIDRLRNDDYCKEKLARERLGFLKDGEVVFLFPEFEKEKNSFPGSERRNEPSP